MGNTSDQITTQRRPLPSSLTKDIEQAGYYPALVADVVESAVAGDEVVSHLVHQETTFDHDTVRRHITVLAMTPMVSLRARRPWRRLRRWQLRRRLLSASR